MRVLLSLLAVTTLAAQQGQILSPDKRKDVSSFVYTDCPLQQKSLTLGQNKGKVAVVAFLAEGFKACTPAVKELNWLQEKEGAMDLVVIPVYDPGSKKNLDKVPGQSGTNAGMKAIVDANPKKDLFREGMFKFVPVSFKVFQEYEALAHEKFFPRFESNPAVYVVDRQGRIASYFFGYQKGQLTKIVQTVLDEK
jgi:peroxiredoxin